MRIVTRSTAACAGGPYCPCIQIGELIEAESTLPLATAHLHLQQAGLESMHRHY
jgi:hypothetical protein